MLEHMKYPNGHIWCSRKAIGGEVEKLSALGNVHFPLCKTESHLPRGGLLSRDETSRKSLKLLSLWTDLEDECIEISSQPSFSASLWYPTLLPMSSTLSYSFWKSFLCTRLKLYSHSSLMNSALFCYLIKPLPYLNFWLSIMFNLEIHGLLCGLSHRESIHFGGCNFCNLCGGFPDITGVLISKVSGLHLLYSSLPSNCWCCIDMPNSAY